MANYFSNHSTSRFLANNTSTPSQPQPQTTAPTPTTVPSRRMSSKHFSTTVNTSQPMASKDAAAVSTPSSATSTQVHPLRITYVRILSRVNDCRALEHFYYYYYYLLSRWVFWFRQQRTPGNKNVNYEEGIKKIAAFSSVCCSIPLSFLTKRLDPCFLQVESFWSLWTHLAPPSALQPTTDYLLFHTGIRRPVWEDPLNLSGGKWIIRLKKGIADRFWEDLVMAIIGDQFDDCRSSKTEDNPKSKVTSSGKSEDGSDSASEWPEICGCTISVRQSEDVVTVWNRVDKDVKLREQIRCVSFFVKSIFSLCA